AANWIFRIDKDGFRRPAWRAPSAMTPPTETEPPSRPPALRAGPRPCSPLPGAPVPHVHESAFLFRIQARLGRILDQIGLRRHVRDGIVDLDRRDTAEADLVE